MFGGYCAFFDITGWGIAANALLSRVYLYMEEYEACIAAADEAMAGAYSVMDLNSWTDGKNVISWTSPETIFTQGGNAVVSTFLSSRLIGIIRIRIIPTRSKRFRTKYPRIC